MDAVDYWRGLITLVGLFALSLPHRMFSKVVTPKSPLLQREGTVG